MLARAAILLAAGSGLAFAPAQHNPNPWEEILRDDGVVIWSRPVPGLKFNEIRAETTLDFPAAAVWALFEAIEKYPQFMPYTAELRVLSTFPDGRYIYVVTDPPIVSRRDYAAKLTDYVDAKNGIYQRTVHEANDRAPPKPEDVERMVRMRGRWTIETIDAGHTRVEYVFNADPGGLVPSWIINAGAKRSISSLFAAIKKRVANPSWRPQ